MSNNDDMDTSSDESVVAVKKNKKQQKIKEEPKDESVDYDKMTLDKQILHRPDR